MEYYAKSPEFALSAAGRDELLEKLDKVIEAFYHQGDEKSIDLLQRYREKLPVRAINTGHKTLKEHLDDTVRCANKFFQAYGRYFSEKEKQLIVEACRLHDVGKANYIFQTKVNSDLKKENREQVPHGFLSGIILSEKAFLKENPQYTTEDFSVLLTAVYYHHNRPDIYDTKQLQDYCESFYLDYVKEYLQDNDISIHISNKNALLFSNRKEKKYVRPNENIWCEYMLVKGMLNKFDWTVSAGDEESEFSMDIEEKKLCRRVEEKWTGKFRPAQIFMMENRDNNVVMIAPTGSGKTEAALMWLNGEKGFYTLPLKVSSNAIYQRIRENYQYKDATLLHSDSMNSYLDRAEGDLESGYKTYEQARRLSYPLTVCTVDQLFRFVYKALGTEIFAATLKYSKIIIDEIQSYSPGVVAALMFGLSEIKRMGGKFAIITATFPPVLQYFMERNDLLKGRDYVWHDFSESVEAVRHRFKVTEGDFNIDEIAERSGGKKVLVICNTVSKAQSLYMELKGRGVDTELLHSRFIRQHRRILEKKIMDFSNNDTATGIWVTTQIVEASLDIDFDILYTEMCTADSLLQRMGRCNRAGKKGTDLPNIYIYNNASGRGVIYDKDIYDYSAELLKKYEGELFSEADKIAYINMVYDVRRIQRTKYFRQIEENLEHFRSLAPVEYSDKDAQEDFRAIRSITVIPDAIYNPNEEMFQNIEELFRASHIDKGVKKLLKDKIADMTLNLDMKYRMPDNIDRATVGMFDIHRTRLSYDFNGNTGMGLLLNKVEEEDYFI